MLLNSSLTIWQVKSDASGGSAAAVMGAMGEALVSMVCNLTIGKTQYRDFEEELKSVLRKAENLRRDLTEMIEEDVRAFDAVMRAYAMPRLTKEETATRAHAIQTALQTATLVPMRCCRACREGYLARLSLKRAIVTSSAMLDCRRGWACHSTECCLERLHQCKSDNGSNLRRSAASGVRAAFCELCSESASSRLRPVPKENPFSAHLCRGGRSVASYPNKI
jgi:hypothetical protein